ncbi:SAM-dependent methyltransferase [Burkholderia mayonis]|uniref:SAM-dependent methyltransferase n=2 Tax=Burkholderiaceae TaxID=119060 RepID=A0A1B4FQA5_9BURK|nr:SAM-dependent methyltransferase [Burkholderia mayonis]KVE37205.1 SAM-dependent methyltransferase [Burkholderia sp. BDU5]KVE44964.1 SAM-dependent methyltransferase [Burkholderia mayonis]
MRAEGFTFDAPIPTRFVMQIDSSSRQWAPATERNREPILDVLKRVLPVRGTVLEIASGTGQHAIHFAAALPDLVWQPTDTEAAARASIAAWAADAALPNLRAPLALDVCVEPWPLAAADAIVCINMIHIAPWAAACALFDGAARVLPDGGVLYLYGPYRRGGAHTAESNAQFDAQLRSRDPAWGVRDLETVAELGRAADLALDEIVEMPANNLSVVFRKRA